MSDTGDGGDYVIDTAQKNADGDSPVVEWWFGKPPTQRIISDDFGAFLWNCVQSLTEDPAIDINRSEPPSVDDLRGYRDG